jgi:hypothetical protein
MLHNAVIESKIRQHNTHVETMLRDCLSRWVSELEPCMVYKGLKFKGLGLADRIDGKAKVYVKARKLGPSGHFMTLRASNIDDDDE